MPEPRLLTKPDALSIFRSSTSGTAIFTAIGRISKTHRRGIRSLSISGTSSGTLSLCIIDFSLNIHANTFAARLRQLSQTELVGREIPINISEKCSLQHCCSTDQSRYRFATFRNILIPVSEITCGGNEPFSSLRSEPLEMG